mmetsp:Transcript_30211/g.94809  ORF Transcript_30211/g.94809 Transcript_30211/m.94809 type:complete len:342 (-) Transcript_30211:1145-2170(-)
MEVDRARSPECGEFLLPLSAGPLSLTSARSPLPAMRWSVRMAPFALASHNAGSTQAGVLDKTPPPSPPPTVCSSCSHHVVAQLGHLRQTRRRARRPRNRLRAGRLAALLLVSDRRGQRGRRREDRPRWDTHVLRRRRRLQRVVLARGSRVCWHPVGGVVWRARAKVLGDAGEREGRGGRVGAKRLDHLRELDGGAADDVCSAHLLVQLRVLHLVLAQLRLHRRPHLALFARELHPHRLPLRLRRPLLLSHLVHLPRRLRLGFVDRVPRLHLGLANLPPRLQLRLPHLDLHLAQLLRRLLPLRLQDARVGRLHLAELVLLQLRHVPDRLPLASEVARRAIEP